MKLIEIVNAVPALQKLNNQNLALQLSYNIMKMADCLQAEIKFFDEQKNRIFEKYGKKRNGELRIPERNEKQANNEFKELLNTDVFIKDEFKKVKIPLSEDIKLSANDITNLLSFVEFTEQEAKSGRTKI